MTLRKTDERMRKLDRAKAIIAKDDHDDPPDSKAIDAALTHLIESHDNVADARQQGELENYDINTLRDLWNTSVLRVHFRSILEQHYRQ